MIFILFFNVFLNFQYLVPNQKYFQFIKKTFFNFRKIVYYFKLLLLKLLEFARLPSKVAGPLSEFIGSLLEVAGSHQPFFAITNFTYELNTEK
jgi:hypothetical protein